MGLTNLFKRKKHFKYILTNETIIVRDAVLHRIKALKDFGDVKKGDLGGYIEGYHNLSEERDCWVYDAVWVYGKARVEDHAKVRGTGEIYGDAKVSDWAEVSGRVVMTERSSIAHGAKVSGKLTMRGSSLICDSAKVDFAYGSDSAMYDNAIISDKVVIKDGDVIMRHFSEIEGEVFIYAGQLRMYGSAKIEDNVKIYGSHMRMDSGLIESNAIFYNVLGFVMCDGKISTHAFIQTQSDFITIGAIGSRLSTLSCYRTMKGYIQCRTGCFNGVLANFEHEVQVTHGDSGHSQKYYNEYMCAIELIKAHMILDKGKRKRVNKMYCKALKELERVEDVSWEEAEQLKEMLD